MSNVAAPCFLSLGFDGFWSCEDCPCDECATVNDCDDCDCSQCLGYDDYNYSDFPFGSDIDTQDTRDAHYDHYAAVKGADPECYCPTCTAANMRLWRQSRALPAFTREDYLDTLTDTLAGIRLRAA